MTNPENDVQSYPSEESLRPALIGAAIFVGVLAIVGCAILWVFEAPSLHIVRVADAVTINVETLGEYPTTISHLRLTEADSGRVVWEVSSTGVAQARAFQLRAGENSATVVAEYGRFETITPSTQVFILRSGLKYKIELWGGTRWTLFKRAAAFQLDNPR